MGRAAGLGWPGDRLLRHRMLLHFEPFSSLFCPHEVLGAWTGPALLPTPVLVGSWVGAHPTGHLLPGRGCPEEMLTRQPGPVPCGLQPPQLWAMPGRSRSEPEDCAQPEGQSLRTHGSRQAFPPATLLK